MTATATSKAKAPPQQVEVKPNAAEAARRMIQTRLENSASDRIARFRQQMREQVYYLACPRDVTHHGIYFAAGIDPTRHSEFHSGEWYSAYHDNNDPWYMPAENVVCQDCKVLEGEDVPLRIRGRNTENGLVFSIMPNHRRRFLKMAPRSVFEKRVKEAEAAGK